MVITGLHQTSPERYRVSLEGGKEIRTTLGVITDLRLFEGKDLDDGQLEEFKLASLRSLTLERSIELLSRRQMSKKELRDKLLRKEVEEDAAVWCADKLETMGLLNEESYAGSVARHYSARGYGSGRVRSELSRRGIPRELWEDALKEMPESDDGIDRLLRKKLRDPDDKDQIRKATASLLRRGFSWEEVRGALTRMKAELESPENCEDSENCEDPEDEGGDYL